MDLQLNLKKTPARMSLVNTLTGDELEAQFNPTELEEFVGVNWNRLPILGLSHMPKQYQQTQNYKPSFELAFRAFDDRGNRLDDCMRARRFLMSLCYPARGGADVVSGSPPRVLFVWPTLISLTCTIDSLTFRHTLFNIQGTPIHSSAKVELDEIRDARICMEDVYAQGTIRSAGGQGGGV